MLIAAFDKSTECVTKSKKAVERNAGKEIILLIYFMNLFSDFFPICCVRLWCRFSSGNAFVAAFM